MYQGRPDLAQYDDLVATSTTTSIIWVGLVQLHVPVNQRCLRHLHVTNLMPTMTIWRGDTAFILDIRRFDIALA